MTDSAKIPSQAEDKNIADTSTKNETNKEENPHTAIIVGASSLIIFALVGTFLIIKIRKKNKFLKI